MTRAEFRYIHQIIDNEGFDSAFVDYTDFVDMVTDPEFHKLRQAYLAARTDLWEYIYGED